MASQGFVGQHAAGVVRLEDADPLTEGATYDTAAFESGDPAVATVEADPNDPLQCTVTLVGTGSTTITCNVDARQGEEVVPLVFSVDVEAQLPPAGEAVAGTFDLGAFEQVA